jgi:hypothetical protein
MLPANPRTSGCTRAASATLVDHRSAEERAYPKGHSGTATRGDVGEVAVPRDERAVLLGQQHYPA